MFALRYLSGAELLTATSTWVSADAEARHRLDALDTTRPLLVPLISARTAVQAALAAREPEDVDNEARGLDGRHDALGRGIFDCLTAFAELAQTEARATTLLALRSALFPAGKRVLRASFADEAGQVDARADRLTPALRTELDALVVEGRSLAVALDEMQTVGRALGIAVVHNAEAEARAAGPSPAGRLRTARTRLTRVVRMVLESLELGGADDATLALFIDPLRIVADDAQRRAIARNSAATARPAPAPGTPVVTPAPTPPRED